MDMQNSAAVMPNMWNMGQMPMQQYDNRVMQDALNAQAQLNMIALAQMQMKEQAVAATTVSTPTTTVTTTAVTTPTPSTADAEVEVRPCSHNDWDDVRTRKGFKVLRCRECQKKWKLLSSNVPRCMPFLHDCCDKGEDCPLLHVRRKKHTISERYEKFGDQVLEGVSVTIATMAQVGSASSDDETTSQSALSSPPESDCALSIVCSMPSSHNMNADVDRPFDEAPRACAPSTSSLNPYMKVFHPTSGSTDGWSELAMTTEALLDCAVWN